MVAQGLEFAAARIQGLARGKHVRRIVSAIWRQAEEHARNVVRGEREARMKKEKEKREKAKVHYLCLFFSTLEKKKESLSLSDTVTATIFFLC